MQKLCEETELWSLSKVFRSEIKEDLKQKESNRESKYPFVIAIVYRFHTNWLMRNKLGNTEASGEIFDEYLDRLLANSKLKVLYVIGSNKKHLLKTKSSLEAYFSPSLYVDSLPRYYHNKEFGKLWRNICIVNGHILLQYLRNGDFTLEDFDYVIFECNKQKFKVTNILNIIYEEFYVHLFKLSGKRPPRLFLKFGEKDYEVS